MKVLVGLLFVIVISTYIYTAYRLYKMKPRPMVWQLAAIVLLPFVGCLIYLLVDQMRTRQERRQALIHRKHAALRQ